MTEHNNKELLRLISKNNQREISKFLSSLDPVDIADIINDSWELKQKIIIFSSLRKKVQAKIFPHINLEDQKSILKEFSLSDCIKIFREIPLDKSADILNNLNDQKLKKTIVHNLNFKVQRELKKIINLAEQSAGGIMTPELCALPKDYTVEQALEVVKKSNLKDEILNVFVITPDSKVLIGVVSIISLISSDPKEILLNITSSNYQYVNLDTDQEEVAGLFRKYGLVVVPVVNEKHQLVGRITFDDILKVSYEEAEEDMAIMAGTPDILSNNYPIKKVVLLRMPWLVLTLALAIANCLVIEKLNFQSSVILATFIPIVMSMGGNTGIQSATVFIRELALGTQNNRSFLRIALKETSSGVVLGIICGGLASLFVFFFIGVLEINIGEISRAYLSFLIFFSTSLTMGFSSFFGAFITTTLNRFSIDPALAAGPFITTLNDIISSSIYFLTSYLLIQFIN